MKDAAVTEKLLCEFQHCITSDPQTSKLSVS